MSNLDLASHPTALDAAILEKVVLGGDLSGLNAAQRLLYYRQVCSSLGLNPLTRPFSYLHLNGKLVLYATKDCTDQLRTVKNISIGKPELTDMGEFVSVTVLATNDKGRTDSDIGVVMKTDMQKNIANVMKKAVTQAKRRVTLSICGLGMLDESEVPDVPGARIVPVDADTGEVVDGTAPAPGEYITGDAEDKLAEDAEKAGLIGRIEAGRDRLKMSAAEFVTLTENMCGVPQLERAELGDLQRMLAELVKRYQAQPRAAKK